VNVTFLPKATRLWPPGESTVTPTTPVPAGEAAVTWHTPLAGVLTLKLVAAVFPKSTPGGLAGECRSSRLRDG
jgi:hypothetical protein